MKIIHFIIPVFVLTVIAACAVTTNKELPAFSETVDIDNIPSPLSSKEYDAIFLVATWCSYSTQLAQAITVLKSNGGIVENKKIAFLIADEWPIVSRKLAEQEDWNDQELQDFKKQRMENALFPIFIFDEATLYDYPGDVFIYPGQTDELNMTYRGYPAGYNMTNLSFDDHAVSSLSKISTNEEQVYIAYKLVEDE